MTGRPPHPRPRTLKRLIRFTLLRVGALTTRELVPNFFTLMGLCAGLTAIRWAVERNFEWALAAIVLAALLDGVDGLSARMLNAQSKFGAEFDSLADFVNFGVAPAILVFTWGLSQMPGVGWTAVLVFAIACGARLARFNATIDLKQVKWEQGYLTGVPAPAGGILVLLPFCLDGLRSTPEQWFTGFANYPWAAWVIVAHTLLTAFLMISTIPTFSGKPSLERLARQYPVPILAALICMLAILALYPYAVIAIAASIYLCLVPVSVRRFLLETARNAGSDDIEAREPTYAPKAGE